MRGISARRERSLLNRGRGTELLYLPQQSQIRFQGQYRLRKIGQEKTFPLAMEKDAAKGMMVPRADLVAAVDALTEKTVVIVKLEHDVLKAIKPYEPPAKGEFVKVTTQKVGTQDHAGGGTQGRQRHDPNAAFVAQPT